MAMPSDLPRRADERIGRETNPARVAGRMLIELAAVAVFCVAVLVWCFAWGDA